MLSACHWFNEAGEQERYNFPRAYSVTENVTAKATVFKCIANVHRDREQIQTAGRKDCGDNVQLLY